VLRTHLKGWQGVFLMEPHVVGELPQRIEDFGAQQSRWSKGFVQVARKLLPQVWHATGRRGQVHHDGGARPAAVFPALAVGASP
jgi:cellulose synthase/poly-beta-1,6-N-acetylglucosamine synthase-like glycosyltransferase